MAALDFLTGGGDDAAQEEANRVRREEAVRRMRMAHDRARINALFGITDFDYNSLPQLWDELGVPAPAAIRNQERKLAYPGGLPAAGGGGPAIPGLFEDHPGSAGTGVVPGAAGQGGSLAQFLSQALEDQMLASNRAINPADPYSLMQQAQEAKTTRERTLEGIYQDILGKFTNELDRQYGRKQSDVKAMLAGRGLSRSSVGQSHMDYLGETYDKRESELEGTAESARERIRSADEDARNALISMINQGGDYANARTSAIRGLESNVNQAYDVARAQNLENLFREMDQLYGQKQYVDEYNRGVRDYTPNITTPGTRGSAGTGMVINY